MQSESDQARRRVAARAILAGVGGAAVRWLAMTRELADEIERYLETGEHDLLFSACPGHGWVEKGRRGKRALLDALIAEVRGRSGGAAIHAVPELLNMAEGCGVFKRAHAPEALLRLTAR